MVKTVSSDIWSLYKGSIIFHLITHDTDRFSWNKKSWKTKINERVFLFETKNYVVIKQHIINNLKAKISWEFILTSRISTLCSGRYMHVIKCLRHHLSGRWSCCTGGRYIERSLTYNPKGGPQYGR